MKSLLLTLSLLLLTVIYSNAQAIHEVHGVIIDTTKLSVPGSQVKLISDQGDSSFTAADADGKFAFAGIKGSKITLTVTSIGYQGIKKHYVLDNSASIDVGSIILLSETNQLHQVNIIGTSPVTIKEDTVEYKVSDYPVRQNAPIEDVIKKLPGVDVDVNGNITAQGKQVTKVRVNGKDFFGGDVQTATKNLPADMIESIQMIDDYGDAANLTGVKTGEPDKIMNITIRKDKNYGYSAQATGGDGGDLLPANQGSDQNRYVGMLNAFDFNGDRQVALLGSLNNTNVNPFNYNTAGSSIGGGGFSGGGGGGGGGGGRGNALRATSSTGLATTANGITDAHSIGTNYRDQWGKYISVYGSYSFTDNSVFTQSNTLQTNYLQAQSSNTQNSTEHDNPVNHRFTFNLEFKPDTINYLKVTPTFSYAGTNTTDEESVTSSRNDTTNLAYASRSISTSSSPTFGLIALYNHRFNGHGRNFSANFTFNTTQSTSYDNPIYNYTQGQPTAPIDQQINTSSRTTTYGTTLSYLEPVGRLSYLELNYAYNHSYTASDKETDTLVNGTTTDFNNYSLLSNNYNYTFVTNRIGLNYRFVDKKYNYTLGVAMQPATLDGQSLTTNAPPTHVTTFNVIPTAHFVYNFQRSQTLSFNYSGSSTQPTFSQLQPVIDYSNALYPVQGNANLKPSFNNNLTIRYNKFSFATGNIFFIGAFFTQTSNYVATSTITYPTAFSGAVLDQHPDLKQLQNTNLTSYLNTNGYYTGTAFFTFAKPWAQRKYTLSLNGNVSYVNNIGYIGSIDSNNVASALERNVAKSLVFTPNVRFRIDITDVIDAQASTSYSITHTVNSIDNPLVDINTNIRALTLNLTGKNYVWKDWTYSYDYTKTINYGYDIPVTNPNVFNTYVERRFLKDNRATIRLACYDVFNQNTGFSVVNTASGVTQTNVNRLGRYYLLTFTLRLQKFAGKAPTQDQPGMHNFRRDGGPGGGGGQGPGAPGGGPALD
jgi:hypothetical protein